MIAHNREFTERGEVFVMDEDHGLIPERLAIEIQRTRRLRTVGYVLLIALVVIGITVDKVTENLSGQAPDQQDSGLRTQDGSSPQAAGG
jgi:hypothetical protein